LLDFSIILLEWHRENAIAHPWKKDKDPYKIWLSEVILQQTRVEQGTPYYLRFLENYPNIQSLAEASEDEVFKLWEGLGYYSRAKNLLFTAKKIAFELKGSFPSTYEDLLNLKGVGKYTAAAIASFAFNLPHAVVDGNVIRVLTRYFGIETPSDTAEGIKLIEDLAHKILNKENPGSHNQAIMDFGSMICKPQKPLCMSCPFQGTCKALQGNQGPNSFPVKKRKIQKSNLYLYYIVFIKEDEIAIRKRTLKEIWPNLYEFYLIESSDVKKDPLEVSQNLNVVNVSKAYKHLLTHRNLEIYFIQCEFSGNNPQLPEGMFFTKNFTKFAFPKVLNSYIKENGLWSTK
jgi:A/G-specific adenine glycosylase